MFNNRFLFRFAFVILFFIGFESINVKPVFNSNSTGDFLNTNVLKIDDLKDTNLGVSLIQIDLNNIVRISAHILVFGLLSLIIFWSLGSYDFERFHRIILTITICSIFGLMDEVLQIYTPNRQFRLLDVLKDDIGAFIFSTFLYNPIRNFIINFKIFNFKPASLLV